MVLPIMSNHVARLRATKTFVHNLSQRMGNTSSENVLRNFIDILQSASPQLKLAIALLTPWALLTTAVLKYSWATSWLDKIKSYVSNSSSVRSHDTNKLCSTRIQAIRNEEVYKKAKMAAPRPLDEANFARRSFREKQTALNLAQFANTNNDLDLGSDQVENLVGTLIVSLTETPIPGET